jgi:hypothetical protein
MEKTMDNTEYTYAYGIMDQSQSNLYLRFRKSERGIEVLITRELRAPEFKGIKRFRKELKNATKNMREAQITTTISTMDEYFHEEREAKLLIIGWIPLTSNEHRKALEKGQGFS